MSRLEFRCVSCGREGSRNESYVPKPGQTPGFEDRCPACKRDNVEVWDPGVRHQTAAQEEHALRRAS
jgi:hypothetical protein